MELADGRCTGRSAAAGSRQGAARIGAALLLALAACAPDEDPAAEAASGSAPAPQGVTVLAVDRALDVGTQALLQRGIRAARSAGHGALVVEIDSPGGAVDLMARFAGMVQAASADGLLTVAWVTGEATSAAALLALACDRVYMRGASTMGSATPVTIGPGGMAPLPEEGGVLEKALSHVRAKFRAVAEAKGRPPVLAEAMVDKAVEVREVRLDGELTYISGKEWDDLQRARADVELVRTVATGYELLNVTGREAVSLGLSDGVAESLDEVLARIGLGDAQPVLLERARSEEALALLTMLSPVLLGLGLLLGWMELKSPGFGLPGILSAVCFVVLLVGRYLTGLADVPHLVLVVVGLALVATELFLFPGTLWLGIIGGLCVVVGLVAAELGPGFDLGSGLDRELALDAGLQLMITAGVTLVAAWSLSRFLPQVPVLNRIVQVPSVEGGAFGEALPEARDAHARTARPGATGVALTALRPVGKVALDEDRTLQFEARSEGVSIDAGARVEVVEVQGGRIVVRSTGPDAADAEARA